MKALFLCLLLLVPAAVSAGSATGVVEGDVLDMTCYDVGDQVISCSPGSAVNKAVVAVHLGGGYLFPVLCWRALVNMGPCLNQPEGSVGVYEGYLLPQSASPLSEGGVCATAVGCHFLSPY